LDKPGEIHISLQTPCGRANSFNVVIKDTRAHEHCDCNIKSGKNIMIFKVTQVGYYPDIIIKESESGLIYIQKLLSVPSNNIFP
jgi:hypothetical protein